MTVPRTLPEGLLAGLAVVLAAAYALRRAPDRGLDGGELHRAWLCAALGGVAGGHALFLATHGGGSAAEWARVWSGGQSVFGVLAGAALCGAGYLAARRLPVLGYADLSACAAALGYAVARAGCFLNGDDFGVPSALPWAVRFTPGTDAWAAHAARGWIGADAGASLPVHPVQLYLAGAGLGIFLYLHRRRLPRGAALGVASLAYGAARFSLEPLRDDFHPVAGPFSLPQLFALALAAGGIALLATVASTRAAAGADRGPPRAAPRPLFPVPSPPREAR
ncbi:MAG TPA: prolipoprotein diacylglyceryl transferase family protein [Longimicrobium sp.]|nr:prolipoprotein diacylglyceryl transferase family protein [Longimicrobium sp.]